MENKLSIVQLEISLGVIKADAIWFTSFGVLYFMFSMFFWNLEIFLWCALLYLPYFIAALFGFISSKSKSKSTFECYSVALIITCVYLGILAITAFVLFAACLFAVFDYGCDFENDDNCSFWEGVSWLLVTLMGFVGLLLASSCVLTISAINHSDNVIGILIYREVKKFKEYQEPLIEQQDATAINAIYSQQVNVDYLR